jgi:hypothetical protein
MATKREKREKNRRKRRFMSDWKESIPGIVIVTILLLLGEFIDKRLYLTLCIVVGFVSMVGLILMFTLLKDVGEGFLFSTAVLLSIASFLGTLYEAFSYSFPDHEFLPFWYISLPVGIVIAIFFLRWIWGNSKVWTSLLSFVIIAALAFFVIEAYLCHFNYILDTHEPTEVQAIIEEKDHDRNRKGPDDYSFKLTLAGESFWLDVSVMEYEDYEIGDPYSFLQYSGAFGARFYVSE